MNVSIKSSNKWICVLFLVIWSWKLKFKKNPLLNRVDINFFVKDSCRHSFPFWMSCRATVEHRMTEEEPFSVTNVYKYNKYSNDPENSSTWSLLGQMIPMRMSSRWSKICWGQIKGLNRQDNFWICLH